MTLAYSFLCKYFFFLNDQLFRFKNNFWFHFENGGKLIIYRKNYLYRYKFGAHPPQPYAKMTQQSMLNEISKILKMLTHFSLKISKSLLMSKCLKFAINFQIC